MGEERAQKKCVFWGSEISRIQLRVEQVKEHSLISICIATTVIQAHTLLPGLQCSLDIPPGSLSCLVYSKEPTQQQFVILKLPEGGH